MFIKTNIYLAYYYTERVGEGKYLMYMRRWQFHKKKKKEAPNLPQLGVCRYYLNRQIF